MAYVNEDGVNVSEVAQIIDYQDASVWYKYFRAIYGVSLSDELMKSEDDFGRRVFHQVDSEVEGIRWDRLAEEFDKFKSKNQDVDLFLTDKEIGLLLYEPRFINYCWIRLLSYTNYRAHREKSYLFGEATRLQEKISRFLNVNDFNNSSRLNSVTKCLQSSDLAKWKKKNYAMQWHSEWLDHEYKDISWISKDDDDNNKWIFEYLDDAGIGAMKLFPNSTEEYYWATLMLLDSEGDTNQLKWAVQRLRKSLSQRKSRAKHQELKYYSIAMSEESKEKLDSIVRKEDTKIYKVIERLINQEYDKI